MQRLHIKESATSTVDFSRTYILVLAEGETAADYSAEIADIEWIQESERFDVWDELTSVENASQAELTEYEVVGAKLDAINAELQEIAAEEQMKRR